MYVFYLFFDIFQFNLKTTSDSYKKLRLEESLLFSEVYL